jgi:hypothetical protein
MTETIRVGSLRGIMMRAPGMTETLPFYLDMWGLSLAHQDDGEVYLRGTGKEPFLYALKDGATYGIEYIHFDMPDRASMNALHAQVLARGAGALAAPASSPTGSVAMVSKCSTPTTAVCGSAPRRACWTKSRTGQNRAR